MEPDLVVHDGDKLFVVQVKAPVGMSNVPITQGKYFPVLRYRPTESDEPPVVDFLPSSEWMIKNFGRAGENFVTAFVKDDAMEPTLRDGDQIVIDRDASRIDGSGVYALLVDEDVIVRRIQRRMDGTAIVKSDNSAYEDDVMDLASWTGAVVLGKVVWPKIR